MRMIKIRLDSFFDHFNFDQHLFVLPVLIVNAKNGNILSNIENQFFHSHSSSGLKKFNQHVPFIILRNDNLVLLGILVNKESQLLVDIYTFQIC